jgi:uncharacterized protein YndB with AHSA1/START domain
MTTNESAPATHGMFTLERVYDSPVARLYQAFADSDAKARWFGRAHGEWTPLDRGFDFRIGGRERLHARWASGLITKFDALYWEIIPQRRIVYTYEMHLDGMRISVSLATLEFFPDAKGSKLIVTEQGAFLNGYDDGGSRERGTADLLDKLGTTLKD